MNIVPHSGPVAPLQQDNPWAITDSDTQTDGLEPGAYVARLERPYVDRERQFVRAPFDIACGPQKGHFSNYPVSREGFHTKFLSYKPRAKPLTAKELIAITKSNPGFDACTSWNTGDFDAFDGKLVGLLASYREVRSSYDGSVDTMPDYTFVPLDALRDGSYVVPGTRHLDGTRDEPTKGTPVDLSELDGDKSDEGSDDELWGGDDDDDHH